jgi:hypothetical protein
MRIRIGFSSGAAVGALAALVALSFAWVAIYSHVLHPGEELAFYQAYARVASPWVSVIAGVPLFWAIGAFARRRFGDAARANALAAFGVYAALSLAITAAAGSLAEIAGMELLSLATKLAALLGAVSRPAGIARRSPV